MRPDVVRWLEQVLPSDVAAVIAPGWFTCVGLAGVVALAWMLARAQRFGVPRAVAATAVLWCYVAAVAAGIVVPIVIDLAYQRLATGHVVVRWAGMTSFWGYLAGVAAVAIVCRDHGIRLARFGDMSCAPLGIALALARVGCFLGGCDYGKVSSLPWAVRFPAGSPAWHDHVAAGLVASSRTTSLPVHPTQLYEALLGVAIAGVALAAERSAWARRRDGRLFLLAAAIYAVGRIAIETLRGDGERGVYAGLSSGQIFSLLALAAIAACACVRIRPMRLAAPAMVLVLCAGVAHADAPDAVEAGLGRLQAGVLVGVAAPLNRRSDQVPALAGPSLSMGYAFGPMSVWIDADSYGNSDATHSTALLSTGATAQVYRGVWIGGRAGLGATLVHFHEPAFPDVLASDVRFESIAEAALGVSWVLWVRPVTFDVINASGLGGPILTFQARIGVAYRFGSHEPPRTTAVARRSR